MDDDYVNDDYDDSTFALNNNGEQEKRKMCHLLIACRM